MLGGGVQSFTNQLFKIYLFKNLGVCGFFSGTGTICAPAAFDFTLSPLQQSLV